MVEPLFVSKVNTLLQFVLLGFALTNPCTGLPGQEIIDAMNLIVCTTTVGSGLAYVHGYINGTVLTPSQRMRL